MVLHTRATKMADVAYVESSKGKQVYNTFRLVMRVADELLYSIAMGGCSFGMFSRCTRMSLSAHVKFLSREALQHAST